MKAFHNDKITILNYQGSKKNLLEFIYKNSVNVIDENKAILDIFSGTCSVGYAFKRYYTIYANDSEYYSSIIAKALLQYNDNNLWNQQSDLFEATYIDNYNRLFSILSDYQTTEEKALCYNDRELIFNLYENYPTVWNGKLKLKEGKITSISDIRENKYKLPYLLFSTYYANTYFGIKQSIEIDSIRYAIEGVKNEALKCMLLSSLFYAMKECVFSKDGHMAQPLDVHNNTSKLFKNRKKSIYSLFLKKVKEFNSPDFVISDKNNRVFNLKSDDIIKNKEIQQKVGFIYADPPYTDMQYSRYYHLLNTISLYDYDDISEYRGKLSKGLYRKSRFQSPLSKRSQAEEYTRGLFEFCYRHNINLAFSYAYPRDMINQAFDRYTMKIEDIIMLAEVTFGKSKTTVVTEEYEHSNNRNSNAKKVLEYLIVCKN